MREQGIGVVPGRSASRARRFSIRRQGTATSIAKEAKSESSTAARSTGSRNSSWCRQGPRCVRCTQSARRRQWPTPIAAVRRSDPDRIARPTARLSPRKTPPADQTAGGVTLLKSPSGTSLLSADREIQQRPWRASNRRPAALPAGRRALHTIPAFCASPPPFPLLHGLPALPPGHTSAARLARAGPP